MYSIESVVSYSKVDKNGILPLFGILNFFQDCTTFQSESIGMGVNHLEKANKAWLLISYKIALKNKLQLGQKVRIGTAPTGFKSIYGNRKFVIETLEGETLVEADSLWTLIDMENRRPVKVTDEEKQGYVLEPSIDGFQAERKIKFSENRQRQQEFKVLKSYIDNNGHMNNADYLRIAVEYIPEEFEYHNADIIYIKEAKQGETIIPFIHIEEKLVELTFEDTHGNTLSKIRLQ